jgi:hypothetical protein
VEDWLASTALDRDEIEAADRGRQGGRLLA